MATTLEAALKTRTKADTLPVNTPYYNRRGDFLAVYFSEEESVSERMCDVVTVYKSIKDGSLTGCKIKGVSLLAENVANWFNLLDGDIEVRLLLLSTLGTKKPHRYIYDLRDLLDDISVPAKKMIPVSS